MNDPYYDPNNPQPSGGEPPAGYTRVEKVGNKYVTPGKKKGKKGPKPRGDNPWANLGVWVIGLGLPVLLIYFMIQKLFVEDIVISKDPYPPVQYEAEQMALLKTLGQEVAFELREGRQELLQRRVLWPEVIYRVSRNMKLTLSQEVTVRDTIHAKNESDIPGLFRQVLGPELTRVPCEFVRLSQREGYPCAIVRTMESEARVLYFEFMTVPVDGKLRIVDIYDLNRGMYGSDAVRREVILEISTDEKYNQPWRAIYGEKRTPQEIIAIKVLLQNDILNRSQALDDIATLSDEVKNTPEIYSMIVNATHGILNGTATQTQLERCKKLLASPPSNLPKGSLVTGMLLAELEGRMSNPAAVEPAALQAHDEIGDAYLKVLVGQRRLMADDFPGAQKMAEEAQKEDRNVPELAPLQARLKDKKPGR